MSVKSYVQAIKDVTAEEMRRDDRVFIMGEDIAEQGGIFGATRGLIDEFGPERVRNTPISECGFLGLGLGAACAGLRPIAELMYMDFSLRCHLQLYQRKWSAVAFKTYPVRRHLKTILKQCYPPRE